MTASTRAGRTSYVKTKLSGVCLKKILNDVLTSFGLSTHFFCF
jgi:hypothetical protein